MCFEFVNVKHWLFPWVDSRNVAESLNEVNKDFYSVLANPAVWSIVGTIIADPKGVIGSRLGGNLGSS
jgi:hypothetical protein